MTGSFAAFFLLLSLLGFVGSFVAGMNEKPDVATAAFVVGAGALWLAYELSFKGALP